MSILFIIMIVLFAFCELLAALGVSHPKVNFGWLGLMFFAISILVGKG